jgi:hypothetical protein
MHQATCFSDVFLNTAKVVLPSHTVLTRCPGKICGARNENPRLGGFRNLAGVKFALSVRIIENVCRRHWFRLELAPAKLLPPRRSHKYHEQEQHRARLGHPRNTSHRVRRHKTRLAPVAMPGLFHHRLLFSE